MAFLSGIFNKQPTTPAVATPATQAPAPQGQNFQAQNPGTGGGAGAVSRQNTPPNSAANPANMPGQPAGAPATTGPEAGPISALDAFQDYFKQKPADPNAQKVPTLNDPYLPALNPEDIQQRLANTNFAANIPQETVQKAISGDPQAFMEAINIAAREAFSASTQLTHGLVYHGARAAAERVSGSLDSRFRNFQVKSQTIANETLAHPAVAPLFQVTRQQIATANPQMTPEQVQKETEKYFTSMAEALAGGKGGSQESAAQPQTPSQTNFASFLPQ